MKKSIAFPLITFLLLFSTSLFSQKKGFYENVQKKNVSKVLDDLNLYAATADFKNYFNLYAEESTFIGTDANEIWTKKEFMHYARVPFEKGKAWSFTSLKRNITFSIDGKYAWFDELLDTQMKLCRGSGVLEKIGNQWKIKQYVLSMTIPNDVNKEIIKIKTPIEEALIQKLK
ncbi:nuclear transport factor 2 family protein [Kaistella sp.]|uniref:nuclear transport factor 2 family protein n=1 Tax=Kaistella sp. TaxID=2782235 RepID=UPI0035A0E34C